MNEVVNPVDVEHRITTTSDRIAKGVQIYSTRLTAWLDAKTAYDTAFAQAYVDADCAQLEKKQRAVLATVDRRRARDVAEAAYRYTEEQLEALRDELRAWQSVGKSVRSMYGAVGATER